MSTFSVDANLFSFIQRGSILVVSIISLSFCSGHLSSLQTRVCDTMRRHVGQTRHNITIDATATYAGSSDKALVRIAALSSDSEQGDVLIKFLGHYGLFADRTSELFLELKKLM
jgi:hypothetical protein